MKSMGQAAVVSAQLAREELLPHIAGPGVEAGIWCSWLRGCSRYLHLILLFQLMHILGSRKWWCYSQVNSQGSQKELEETYYNTLLPRPAMQKSLLLQSSYLQSGWLKISNIQWQLIAFFWLPIAYYNVIVTKSSWLALPLQTCTFHHDSRFFKMPANLQSSNSWKPLSFSGKFCPKHYPPLCLQTEWKANTEPHGFWLICIIPALLWTVCLHFASSSYSSLTSIYILFKTVRDKNLNLLGP